MPTELELALQAGGAVVEDQEATDLQRALQSGGKIQPTESKTTPIQFLNRGIAATLGAPVDVVNAAIGAIPGVEPSPEPFLGRKSIERGLKGLGKIEERIRGVEGTPPVPPEGQSPRTMGEYIGSTIGEVSGLLIPTTMAAQVVSKGTGLAARVSQSIISGMQKYPKLAMTSEVAGGAGAGAGRFASEELLPEDSLVGKFTELSGGLIGGLAPTALTYTPVVTMGRLGQTVLKKISLPFTEAGAKFRAGKFIKAQVTKHGQVAEKVVEQTIGELPPVVASGEKRLLQLYNQFRQADPVTDAKAMDKIAHSITQLEFELRGMGYAAPEILRNVTTKRLMGIEAQMQNRVASAMRMAQQRLDAIPVATRQSQESIIVRDELTKAMRQAMDDPNIGTKILWSKVPKNLEVGYAGSKQAYSDLLSSLSRAERGDIPAVLKNSFLAKKRAPKFPVTVREMQGLRSKLLEVQRIARKNGEWNAARISGDMADSILDDLSTHADVDESLRTALAATRQFKERFERGIVGKLLGFSKTGAPSISPDLTLDVSIGRAGVSGAVDADKIGVSPDAVAAVKRYLGRSFTDYVTDRGTTEFNARKAGRWIESNREILDQYPDLRQQLSSANQAQEFAATTQAKMTARMERLRDPRISTTARFLQADPGKEIEAVFKSSNPTQMTGKLILLAKGDATGEALKGLKGAYMEHLFQAARSGPFNELGEYTLSGKRLLGFVNEQRAVFKQVLTPDELNRVERIGKELIKVDLSRTTTGTIPLELTDTASSFITLINRVGGAQLGQWVARITGGGTVQTPGIFSERFRTFARHINTDRAFKLIHDAITADDGGQLLQALLLPIDKPTSPAWLSNLGTLNARMNLWLAGPGQRVLDDIVRDDEDD